MENSIIYERTIDAGNNETITRGVYRRDGLYYVLYFYGEKEFKTRKGALRFARKWNVIK